jgi:NAD(P)-dependent dehydrogenase (short-subunit alcohol dehydrogenase family)
MFDLSGRVVVVTGGNTGIGLGIGRGIGAAGGAVAIWARNEARNRQAVHDLTGEGVKAVSWRCDVTDEDDVGRALDETVEHFGHIDSLFANAGIMPDSAFVDMTLAEWRSVLAVNLDGAFLSLRAAARHLVTRGEGGSLVVVSSTAALHGAPRREHYATSKAGLVGLMRSLAVELARHRIRVNALLPGWTDTGMLAEARTIQKFVDNTVARTPVRRWAAPADFAEAAVFLADPTIAFHTGDTLVVDGGYTVF